MSDDTTTVRTPPTHPLRLLDPPEWCINALKGTGFNPKDSCPPKATLNDIAKVTKTPTAAQVAEINAHVRNGNEAYRRAGILMATAQIGAGALLLEQARVEWQHAVDKTVAYYGIDTSNVKGKITVDPFLANWDAWTTTERTITVGPSLFTYGPTALAPSGAVLTASTIVHEATHTNQMRNHGVSTHGQQCIAYELMGYESVLAQADKLGLTPGARQYYTNEAARYRSGLEGNNPAIYDRGEYWNMEQHDTGFKCP